MIRTFMPFLAAALVASSLPAQAQQAPAAPRHRALGTQAAASTTSFFYTTYEQSADRQSVEWTTCGHDTTSGGCYGSGSLTGFGRTCGVAGSSTLVVVGDTSYKGQSAIDIYSQVSSATPSATLLRRVVLNVPASNTASCYLAVIGAYAFFGTSESAPVSVNLKTGAVLPAGICGGNTAGISTNGQIVTVNDADCFAVFDANGSMQEDGGRFGPVQVPTASVFQP